MTGPWDQAIARALDDDEPPATLAEAVAGELVNLWSDLEAARSHAIRGRWSMACDWLTERIITLTRLTGPTPWEQIPTSLLLDGTYEGILTAAGITYEPPDMGAVFRLVSGVAVDSDPWPFTPGLAAGISTTGGRTSGSRPVVRLSTF